jgi:predicted dehydrogenase
MDRRNFLKQTAAVGTGTFLAGGAPGYARSLRPAPNERIRFACIGVGGKGSSDTDHVAGLGEIVGLCDVDADTLDDKANTLKAKHPGLKKYYDYRKMLEDLGDKIDAVTVSTPDHTHAPASVLAMRMGKHVYCQKPLTWSIEEARMMRGLAAEKKLCTQMGNQGTADSGFRSGVEVLRSGVIGQIKEILVWTNRPIWPQGMHIPKDTPGIPNKVRWSEFLGPAHDRPYHPSYQPFNWRGWLDFGTGALGDMACHTINIAAMALELFDPETIEVVDTSGIVDNASYPVWSIIKTQFGPRNGRGPLTMTWYDGGEKLPKDKRSYTDRLYGERVPRSGLLLVGEKGSFFSRNDYGAEHVLLPKDQFKEVKKPSPTLPRHEKGDIDVNQKREWVEAIRAGRPEMALSNFDYASQLTETVLLGVVALKAGRKIEWDAPGMRAKNCSYADEFIRRDYRRGYSIH